MQASGSEGGGLSGVVVKDLVNGAYEEASVPRSNDDGSPNGSEKTKINGVSVEAHNPKLKLKNPDSSSPSLEVSSSNSGLDARVCSVSDQAQDKLSLSESSEPSSGVQTDANGNICIYVVEEDDFDIIFEGTYPSDKYCIDEEKGAKKDGSIILKPILLGTQIPDVSQETSASISSDSRQPFDSIVSDSPDDPRYLDSAEMDTVVQADYPESDSGSLVGSYIDLGDEQSFLEPGSSDPELPIAPMLSDTGAVLDGPELQLPLPLLPKGEHDRSVRLSGFELNSNDEMSESDDDVLIDTGSYDFCGVVSGGVGKSPDVETVVTDGPAVVEPLGIGSDNAPLNELDEQQMVHESNELVRSQAGSVSQNLDSEYDAAEPLFLKSEVTEHSSFAAPAMEHLERPIPEDQLSIVTPSSSVDSLEGQGVYGARMECLTSIEIGAVVKKDDPEPYSGNLGESHIEVSDDQLSLEAGSSAPELSTVALSSDTGRAIDKPEGELDKSVRLSDFELDSNDEMFESDDDVLIDTDSYDLCGAISGDVGKSTEIEAIVTDVPEVLEPLSIATENAPLNEMDEQQVVYESNDLVSSQADSFSQNLDFADDAPEPLVSKAEVTEHSSFASPAMGHLERSIPEDQLPTVTPSSSVASLEDQGGDGGRIASWIEVYEEHGKLEVRSLAGSFSEDCSVQSAQSGELDGQGLTEQVGPRAAEPDFYNARELKTDRVVTPMPMASIDSPIEGMGLPLQFSAEQSTLHLVLRLRGNFDPLRLGEGFDQWLQNTEYQPGSGSFSSLSDSSAEDSTYCLSTTSESNNSSMVSSLSGIPSEDDAETESRVSASSSRETLCSSRETLCDDEENVETDLPELKNTLKEPLVASTHSTSESIRALLSQFDPLFESRPDDMSTDCKKTSTLVSGQETLARENTDRLSQPHRRTYLERVSEHKGYKGWLEDHTLESRVPSRWEHSPRGEKLHWYDACWNDTLRSGFDFTEDVRYRCMPVLEYRSELQPMTEKNDAFNYSPVKPEKRVQTEFRKNADIQQYNAFVNDQVAGLNASVEAHKKDKNGLRLSALCAQENQRQEPRFKATNTSLNQIRKQQSGLTYNVNGEELVWRAFETDTSF
ncbi:hypothetical protein [Endozoicomonas elysicola]|uniref:Uncharacterized protein n=1 Tax=Endozoicomonas elysicola TaxID=305900 RepID=A0A081KFS6_9GAMM|nr:hypothetical protein [Endozoicomonas elysicola]KEI73002.1 hypothetical protein GV64_21820 [Endozoicomonas elysicola]